METSGGSAEYPDAEAMAQLERVLDWLAEGRAYRPTLNGMLALVEAVEREYDWSSYEYFHDLHVRSLLQAVLRPSAPLRGPRRRGRGPSRALGPG